jgi:hypothetical protein
VASNLGEQLTRRWIRPGRGLIRWLKRQTSKARRRLERQDPEDAPKRNGYRGWLD